jgi:hypothetical protein
MPRYTFPKGHKINLCRYPSDETRKKLSKTRKILYESGIQPPHSKGKESNNWKGGITINISEYNRVYKIKYKERKAGRPKSKQCEICNSESKIVFDHNHETGKFRGWICNNCNWILGLAKDNKKILYLIIEYLNKNDGHNNKEGVD